MSECVVRMEMPKNCCECQLRQEDFDTGEEFCPFTGVECLSIGRQNNCPILCQLPEGHGRLVDADAYSAEMKDRQNAAWKWRNEAIAEEDDVKLARAEGAYTAFTEAKLTMDKHIINPWHRVEVEEPSKAGWYLVMDVDGDFNVDEWHNTFGWHFVTPSDADRITYWMPIEPPKEDA